MSENLPEAELRKAVEQQVLRGLAGIEVLHPSFLKPILINRKGLKHCISRRYNNPIERLLALPAAPELLARATYLSKEADNHVPPRPGIFVHRLQASHEVQGVSYGIWLYVRETPNSLHFYDLGIIIQTQKPPALAPGATGASLGHPGLRRGLSRSGFSTDFFTCTNIQHKSL